MKLKYWVVPLINLVFGTIEGIIYYYSGSALALFFMGFFFGAAIWSLSKNIDINKLEDEVWVYRVMRDILEGLIGRLFRELNKNVKTKLTKAKGKTKIKSKRR